MHGREDAFTANLAGQDRESRANRGAQSQCLRSWQEWARGRHGNQPAGMGLSLRAGEADGTVAGVDRSSNPAREGRRRPTRRSGTRGRASSGEAGHPGRHKRLEYPEYSAYRGSGALGRRPRASTRQLSIVREAGAHSAIVLGGGARRGALEPARSTERGSFLASRYLHLKMARGGERSKCDRVRSSVRSLRTHRRTGTQWHRSTLGKPG